MFMVLSGYTFSISCNKKRCFIDNYRFNVIVPRLLRFSIPIFVEELVYAFVKIMGGVALSEILDEVVKINCGPGSYYFVLILSLTLIFPLIFSFIKEGDKYAVCVLIIINILFEYMATLFNISSYWYARSIFAYLGFVGVGSWIYFRIKDQKSIGIIFRIITAVIGILWIYLTRYTEYKDPIFTLNTYYALPVLFWVANLIYGILTLDGYCSKINNSITHTIGLKINDLMALVGRASYHILCTQMVWFVMINRIRQSLPVQIGGFLWLIISVVVCTVSGVVFYFLESKVTGNIIKKMRVKSII